MIRYRVGTSGYSYDDWKGPFYPRDLPKNRMLEFYAGHFSCSEINATYYAIPGTQVFERLVLKVPDDFDFIVKVNRETTHIRKENETALKALTASILPLREAGCFKGFLAQFPYSFRNTEANRRYLSETRRFCDDLPLFAEFRHQSWNKPALHNFLKSLDIGYVNVDEPELDGLLPAESVVTADTAYIRFHGRNKKKWWDGKGMARYDYNYNEEELRGWLTNISTILKKAYKTYIFFNNHPNGQAVRNAKQMITILEEAQKDLFQQSS